MIPITPALVESASAIGLARSARFRATDVDILRTTELNDGTERWRRRRVEGWEEEPVLRKCAKESGNPNVLCG